MRQLFKKDITRPINGVVKVGQLGEEDIRQELEEYVITRELNGYFDQFFSHFTDALDGPTDRIGVWISGFFGSGKSHFLKILSYLLADDAVGGKRATAYFEPKIADPSLVAAIQRAARAPKDVILFNIDSKASANSKSDKEAIVKVFQKVFDEHLGYFAVAPAIANFERRLSKQGKYAAFQEAYRQRAGKPWTEDRENWDFKQDEIVAALQAAMDLSENAATSFFENVENTFDISVESFAKAVKEWLDEQGQGHHLFFMVDEVGQYVGENSDLMLNLQTVAEDLGTYCEGRAWIAVTSQEDIDSITENRVKGDDFSKIQGRFKNRISLSSANTDEVIRLRLLEKTDDAAATLRALFGRHEQTIKSVIRFSQGTAEMPNYLSAEDFVRSYPFVPYQFKLLQRVFTQIRLHGASGKHLSQGERSMLDAFQIAAKALLDEPLGSVAPFHLFYGAVEGFLDGSVKLIITQAADHLEPFDVQLLKTLFMIKYVKEIQGTVENLTTLSLGHLEQDRLALKERVQGALDRLERETLIQRSGDVYEFLTNEEQDVGREIKNFMVPSSEVTAELQKIMWGDIFPDQKYRFDPRHDYRFNKMLDGRLHSQQSDDLTLHIVTPDGDEYHRLNDDAAAMLRSGQGNEMLVRLPDQASADAFDELRLYVRTDRYVMQKNRPGLSASLRTILQTRSDENRGRRHRVRDAFEKLVAEADVFVHGDKLPKTGSTARDVLTSGLRQLVEAAFPKLDYVKSHFDDIGQIEEVLRRGRDAVQVDIEGNVPNALAHDEMLRWLQEQQDYHQTVSLKTLEDRFTKRPYGWSREDAHGVLAELLVTGKAELKRAQGNVNLREEDLARTMMSRRGLEQHTVRVPRIVNPEALRVAQELMKEYLGNPTPPNDPQELYMIYRERLQHRADLIAEHLRKARAGPYPFKDELQAFEKMLGDLKRETSAAALFDALLACEQEFEEMAEESTKIEGFFRNQIELFDRTREKLRALEGDLRHVTDAELLQRVGEAKRILALPDPTRDIPQLGGMLAPVEKHVQELIECRKQAARTAWQEAVQATSTFAKEQGVEESRIPQLIEPLTTLESSIDQADSIDAAIARQAAVDAARQQVDKAIIDHINVQVHTEDKKPIKVVRPARFAEKEILETKQDIEAYVGTVRKRLLEEHEAGHRLRIE